MKPTLIMLCGIPGCGKSTYAVLLSNCNYILHSSDDIRAELGDVNDQSRDQEVFEILHNRIKTDLRKGNKVIYDATNIKREYREKFLESLSDIKCKKEIMVFLTDLNVCLERNNSRDRQVPEEVVKGMRMWFEYPTRDEGWDEITYRR